MKQMRGQLALAGAPPAPNHAAEANSYIEEARWALTAEMPGRAHTAAEAAWALGDHTIETARLRVQSAFGALKELASRRVKPDELRAEEWLDLAIHGVGVWRDVLESELVRGKPQELQRWLESAGEMTDAAMLAIVALPSATDQIPHAEKLGILRETHQAALRAAFGRAAELSATAPRLARR